MAIVLCCAYPMLHLLSRLLGRYIQKLGHTIGIDSNAVTGILGGLANTMPLLGACNSMSPVGLVVAMAFAVSAILGAVFLCRRNQYPGEIEKSGDMDGGSA